MNFYNKYYRYTPAAISLESKPDYFPAILIWMIPLFLLIASCKKSKTEDNLPKLGTCLSVAPAGGLMESAVAGSFTYQTSGGGTIYFDGTQVIQFKHNDYPNFKYELWGDLDVNGQTRTSANHENLNGKHIKDRHGNRRTFIFPDGTKFTLIAKGEQLEVLSASIYDGNSFHHVNLLCGKIEYSSINAGTITKRMDDAEADGETATIEFKYENGSTTPTGLILYNLYKEDTPGNKQMNKQKLGELFINEPHRVNDHYDDPRLGST